MDYTITERVMSEYVVAEIHDSMDSLELRWEFDDRTYGLTFTPEMFDLLALDEGQESPVLTKIMRPSEGWQNNGVEIREDGYHLA
jgi:hypothetical protein